MKVHIESESQSEFDSKREILLKALAGNGFDVEIKPSPRRPKYRAQADMVAYWDIRFKEMLVGLRGDIDEALK